MSLKKLLLILGCSAAARVELKPQVKKVEPFTHEKRLTVFMEEVRCLLKESVRMSVSAREEAGASPCRWILTLNIPLVQLCCQEAKLEDSSTGPQQGQKSFFIYG